MLCVEITECASIEEVWQIYLFLFSFMPITFENVHTCISIHNTYAYEMSSDVTIMNIYTWQPYLFCHIIYSINAYTGELC